MIHIVDGTVEISLGTFDATAETAEAHANAESKNTENDAKDNCNDIGADINNGTEVLKVSLRALVIGRANIIDGT